MAEGYNSTPVVLKPVRQGSSVGLQMVDKISEWETSMAEAFRHDTQVLMEERIIGRETTVGILAGRGACRWLKSASKKPHFRLQKQIHARRGRTYLSGRFSPDATAADSGGAALTGPSRPSAGRDYARVDVMVRANGEPLVLEVNTLPGMTETSVLTCPKTAAGIRF